VFAAIGNDEPVVRMRAADAIEKITQVRPELLRPHVDTLLAIAASAEDKEVRWHVAQLLGRVTLKTNQRDEAVKVLLAYLSDNSNIVKTFAMQTLVDLAADDENLQSKSAPAYRTSR